MSRFSLSHLANATLHRSALAVVARDRTNTAELISHLAEIESRRMYAEMGYPSMHSYCVGALSLEDGEAYPRIAVARVARRYPAIFEAMAEGRLHLSAVLMLSAYLTPENVNGLLSAAAKKSKSEIEQMLAERFPRTESLPMVTALPSATTQPSELPPAPKSVVANLTQLVPERVMSSPQVAPIAPRVTPIAPQRFEIRLSVGQSTHYKLRYLQELSGESDLEALL